MSEEGGPCVAGPGVGDDGGPQSEKIEVALSEISKRAALSRQRRLLRPSFGAEMAAEVRGNG